MDAAREGDGGAVVGTGSDISPGGDTVDGMSNTWDNDGGGNRYRRIFSWGCGDYGCLGRGGKELLLDVLIIFWLLGVLIHIF